MRDKNTLTVSRCTFNVSLSYAAGADPQDRIAQLESQLKAMELELQRATKDLQEAKGINAELRRDIEGCCLENKKLRADLDWQQKVKQSMRADIDGMSDELQKARRQNDELRRDLESSLAYNKKLREELDWQQKVKQSMRADIVGMFDELRRNIEAQLKG